MKLIVILCDLCGQIGGAHHRSAERARGKVPEGWETKQAMDLCSECVKTRSKNLAQSGKAIRDLAQVVQKRSEGATFDQIGAALGFTKQYAQQLWTAWNSSASGGA